MDNIILKDCDLTLPKKGLPSSSNQIRLMRTTFNSVINKWNNARFSSLQEPVKVGESVIDRMNNKINVLISESSFKAGGNRPLKINVNKMFNNIVSNVGKMADVKDDIDLFSDTIIGGIPEINDDSIKNEIDVVKTADLNSDQLARDVQETMNEPVNIEVADVPVFDSNVEKEITRSDINVNEDVSNFVIPREEHIFPNNNVVNIDKFDEFGNIKNDDEKQEYHNEVPIGEKAEEDNSSSLNFDSVNVDTIPKIVINENESEIKTEIPEEDNTFVIRGGEDTIIVPDIKQEERFVSQIKEESPVNEASIDEYVSEDIKDDNIHFDYSEATKEDVEKAISFETSTEGLKALKERAIKLQEEMKKSEEEKIAAEMEQRKLAEEASAIRRKKEAKIQEFEDWVAALQEAIKVNRDSTEALKNDALNNEKFIKSSEAEILDLEGMMGPVEKKENIRR